MPQIHRSSLLKKLYAQDASMYQDIPEGVSFPKNSRDIQELVLQAATEGFSITARSAGTSLAGQTTGKGVVMDVSRFMTRIIEFNEKEVLKDDATYIFNLGDAVSDFREGNKVDNLSFVFSTGDVIDSLGFSGSVVDAFT